MLFYFIEAVRTSAIKYSTITVQRKYPYVGGDMLICRGNRQFGLCNRRNIYMCTSAWQFAPRGKLKNVWRWQLSPDEFDFLLCAIREQKITGCGRWRGPKPPPARVTHWSRVQAGRRDWLQQFQLMNIYFIAQLFYFIALVRSPRNRRRSPPPPPLRSQTETKR